MQEFKFSVPESVQDPHTLRNLLDLEWLVTNGLGGYSSGTICGVRTRKYHGLLVAELPRQGRMVMLNELSQLIRLPDGTRVRLDAEERAGQSLKFEGEAFTCEFQLHKGLPIWRYSIKDFIIEKRLIMPHQQNALHIVYRVIKGEGRVDLSLRPAVNFRQHDSPVNLIAGPYTMTIMEDRYELAEHDDLTLRFLIYGTGVRFSFRRETIPDLVFRVEEERGFKEKSQLWSPGHFHVYAEQRSPAALVVSTHSWETTSALEPEQALVAEHARRDHLISLARHSIHDEPGRNLVFSADQFLIRPAGRRQDAIHSRAEGYELTSIIAGYHWFTDWGRDTMISLEGLTLVTGRQLEAYSTLRTFSQYIQDGLIPNMFPEGETKGRYNTADATLWYFHALDKYVKYTEDRVTLRLLLPKLIEIVQWHLKGTRFGIKVDPTDGLLAQGEEGYQLTWMDAKVGDWVVTPRRGKAVEINALWYNALKLLSEWVKEEIGSSEASALEEHAKKTYASFNDKFWYAEGGYLYDVVDGEHGSDPACRPNQLFSMSLEHPVLDRSRWESVMRIISQRLLTPVGLRSLDPRDPDYKRTYYGDLRSRDAAYHQGTVWAWLIGAYVDVWLKLHPEKKSEARSFLYGLLNQLDKAGIGSVSEIFDGGEPYNPRGCIAQAWSIAELLRCWVKITDSD